MFEIGRVCVKIAGREAGKTAVVVDKVSSDMVLIDGNVRRKKCNIKHLEPLKDVLKVKRGASTSDVHKIMISAKIKVVERKKIKKSTKKKEVAPKKK